MRPDRDEEPPDQYNRKPRDLNAFLRRMNPLEADKVGPSENDWSCSYCHIWMNSGAGRCRRCDRTRDEA